MRIRTKTLPVGPIEFFNAAKANVLTIPVGTVVISREYIKAGDEELPGRLSWELRTGSVMALPLLGETVRAVFGKYSGDCFLKSSDGPRSIWRGAGRIDGLDENELFAQP